MTDPISPELKTVMRRLKLSRMLDTLPERLALARQQKMPHQELLLLVLSDEASRRDSAEPSSVRSEATSLTRSPATAQKCSPATPRPYGFAR